MSYLNNFNNVGRPQNFVAPQPSPQILNYDLLYAEALQNIIERRPEPNKALDALFSMAVQMVGQDNTLMGICSSLIEEDPKGSFQSMTRALSEKDEWFSKASRILDQRSFRQHVIESKLNPALVAMSLQWNEQIETLSRSRVYKADGEHAGGIAKLYQQASLNMNRSLTATNLDLLALMKIATHGRGENQNCAQYFIRQLGVEFPREVAKHAALCFQADPLTSASYFLKTADFLNRMGIPCYGLDGLDGNVVKVGSKVTNEIEESSTNEIADDIESRIDDELHEEKLGFEKQTNEIDERTTNELEPEEDDNDVEPSEEGSEIDVDEQVKIGKAQKKNVGRSEDDKFLDIIYLSMHDVCEFKKTGGFEKIIELTLSGSKYQAEEARKVLGELFHYDPNRLVKRIPSAYEAVEEKHPNSVEVYNQFRDEHVELDTLKRMDPERATILEIQEKEIRYHLKQAKKLRPKFYHFGNAKRKNKEAFLKNAREALVKFSNFNMNNSETIHWDMKELFKLHPEWMREAMEEFVAVEYQKAGARRPLGSREEGSRPLAINIDKCPGKTPAWKARVVLALIKFEDTIVEAEKKKSSRFRFWR